MRDEMVKIAGAFSTVGNFAAHHAKDIGHKAVGGITAFKNPMQAIKSGWKSDGSKMGRFWQGATVVGGATGAPAAFAREDKSGRNQGRGERIGRWAGDNIGGLVGAKHGFTGGTVASLAANTGAGMVGRGADKVFGRRKPVPPVVQPRPAVVQPQAPGAPL
jgi:hypothetical protein